MWLGFVPTTSLLTYLQGGFSGWDTGSILIFVLFLLACAPPIFWYVHKNPRVIERWFCGPEDEEKSR